MLVFLSARKCAEAKSGSYSRIPFVLITVSLLTVLATGGLAVPAGEPAPIAGPEPDKPLAEGHQQGLIVRFVHGRSGQQDARSARLPALHVPAEQPVTPFLEPGPFEATWEGWVQIAETDTYTFRFQGSGRLSVTIGDVTVLEAERPDDNSGGGADAKPVELSRGFHRLHVHYHSPEEGGEPARMRLLWSSSWFGPEPLPPTALFYDGADGQLDRHTLLREGRTLMAEHSCLKCHGPEDPSWLEGSSAMPELQRDAPALTDAGSRLQVQWMARWIADPQSERSSATMPHAVRNVQEAADIAAYLATLGDAPADEEAVPAASSQIRTGAELYSALGCVACHTLELADEEEAWPARLSLAHVAAKWHGPALADFLQEPARHYLWTGMPDFDLDTDEAKAIAAFLLDESRESAPAGAVSRDGDRDDDRDGDVKRGMELLGQRGCNNCHDTPVESRLDAPSLETLAASDWRLGCFAEQEPDRGTAPRPVLDADEREALREFAEEGLASLERRSPIEFAARQIRSLNCQACHQLDGEVDQWTQIHHDIGLFDQSFEDRRPSLTWVGEKLQSDWLEQVLAGTLDHKPRPWMEARMPAVGADPALLAQGFNNMHGFEGACLEPDEPDPGLVVQGRSLATGIGGGFGCQTCHGGSGGGYPAVGLDLLGERLRPQFFHWKMHAPRRVDPQTAMPRFADPEGRTRLRDRFDGDAQRQFEAIWHYLVGQRADQQVERDDDARPPRPPSPTWAERYQRMQTGPFYSGILDVPDHGRLEKGLAIRVGPQQQATMYFDTDLLRMAAGWTGDFLEFRANEDFGVRNSPPPAAAGELRFGSPEVAGWVEGAEPHFTDPRDRGSRRRVGGPIPEDQARYEGLYVHGDRVVLDYTVRGTRVHESPWYIENEQTGAFIRDVQLEGQEATLSMLVFEADAEVHIERQGPRQIAWAERDGQVTMTAIRAQEGATLVAARRQVALRIDPQPATRALRVLVWQGAVEAKQAFLDLAAEADQPHDLDRLREPGPRLWEELLVTDGRPGDPDGPYSVDRITAPVSNPYDALVHFTGLDFLPDGRAVLTTMHGDVWTVDGLDDSLQQLTWQRLATGLNMPFGVRVVDGKIYVCNEDELTILHDRSGNGEADYYENFANLIAPGAGSWRQAFGLEVDDEGYFYFARGRGRFPEGGNAAIRISPDGREMEVLGTGYRQPWAIGLSPAGRMTVTQQEGTWVPQTPIHKLDFATRKGSFYGFDPDRSRREDPYPRALGYEPPIVWLPRNVDNSAGGQVWVAHENWGLPQGQMLHMSYSQGTLMQLMHEQVEGDRQGGVAPLLRLARVRPRTARFHPQDGHLYVAGHTPEGGFERVRYTGGKVHQPVAIHAHENGLRIRFQHPLDAATATDPANYEVRRWNYRWDADYGSEYYSLEHPDRLGEDPVAVSSVSLLSDGREIFLEIPDMIPVMQMRVVYDLEADDGTPMQQSIYNTVHALRPAWQP